MGLYCSKKRQALSRRVTSKRDGGGCCLNYFQSFRTKKYLNRIKNYVKINIFLILCVMPFEDTKISELNQYQKCDKTPFIV